jgi:hypothetical protein
MDFNAWGSYSQYNWELFYHAPMLVAQKLSNNQRFEDAMKWYHCIFNPTDASALPSPQRFWNTKPFFNRATPDYLNQRIDQILNMINNGDTELIKDVDDWRKNPFEPHLIAQFRTVAYQKTTVMKYMDNLIAWGDNLFRTDTRENITAATQMYILAAEILGPKPKTIPNFLNRLFSTTISSKQNSMHSPTHWWIWKTSFHSLQTMCRNLTMVEVHYQTSICFISVCRQMKKC